MNSSELNSSFETKPFYSTYETGLSSLSFLTFTFAVKALIKKSTYLKLLMNKHRSVTRTTYVMQCLWSGRLYLKIGHFPRLPLYNLFCHDINIEILIFSQRNWLKDKFLKFIKFKLIKFLEILVLYILIKVLRLTLFPRVCMNKRCAPPIQLLFIYHKYMIMYTQSSNFHQCRENLCPAP